MEANKDPVEQLDRILTFMATSSFAVGRISLSGVLESLKKEGYEISGGDLVDVMNQLIEDGYVYEQKPDSTQRFSIQYSTYRATWAGKYFQKTLGYKKKVDKGQQDESDRKEYILHERYQNARIEDIQKQNIFLTEILAWTAVIVCFVTTLQLLLNFLKDFPGVAIYWLMKIFF